MFVHNQELNPCKCGSKEKPDLDSDDMVPTWNVYCPVCGQTQNAENWSLEGACVVWNRENPTIRTAQTR